LEEYICTGRAFISFFLVFVNQGILDLSTISYTFSTQKSQVMLPDATTDVSQIPYISVDVRRVVSPLLEDNWNDEEDGNSDGMHATYF